MKRQKTDSDLVRVEVPAATAKAAYSVVDDRMRSFIKLWANSQTFGEGMPVQDLVRNCYLQGLMDGISLCENGYLDKERLTDGNGNV